MAPTEPEPAAGIRWVQVSVGAVLTLTLTVPLLIIVRRPILRRDSVVGLIVNLLLAGVLCTVLFFFASLSDALTGDSTPDGLCLPLCSFIVGAAISFKLAALSLAVEQFVAIIFSLRHGEISGRWHRRLVAITWLGGALFSSASLVSYGLGCETTEEFNRRVLGVQNTTKRCNWFRVSNVVMLCFEVTLLTLSVSTCALLVITAAQGGKQERKLAVNDNTQRARRFTVRFKAFKRIVKVLLTLVVLDVLGAAARISSRWTADVPLITVISHARKLAFILDCWIHGLSYRPVRNALKDFFGFRQNELQVMEPPQES